MKLVPKTIAVAVAAFMSAAAMAQGFEQPPATVVVERAAVTFLAPSVDVPGTVVSLNDCFVFTRWKPKNASRGKKLASRS
jgi:hypothetical protein